MPRAYSELDTLVVKEMLQVHEKLMLCGKFLEMEYPAVDRVVPQVRKIEVFLVKLIQSTQVSKTVKIFVGYLLANFDKERRFKNFPDVFLAAALLNPDRASRQHLKPEEIETAKKFINALEKHIPIEREDSTQLNPPPIMSETTLSTIDEIFNEIEFETPKRIKLAPSKAHSGLLDELESFVNDVDDSRTAFEFFKQERKQWMCLSHIARIILCTLPSPACAERTFSRAAFLSASRRSRMMVSSLKTRLIMLSG